MSETAMSQPAMSQPENSLLRRWPKVMSPALGRPKLALVQGQGAVLTGEDGRSYLDMFGGIAVNALGHAHPAVIAAVTRQVATLGHVSNLYAADPPVRLAERLLLLANNPGRVFFANSGAGAVEAAFKLSRCTGRTHIVAANNAFHGRTMGALSLTGQPGKVDPFRPLPGDVTHIPYGDVAALEAAVTAQTAMVILEPIQGEAGVLVPPAGYLAAARRITNRHGALLVLDEVQTGVGRTGHWFAFQTESVLPDAVTLAKGLGGGLPIGALVAFGAAGDLLAPGTHASTFGGNPVCCAAALAVLDTIAADGLMEHARGMGERLRDGIERINHPLVSGVRGAGLLLGVVLTAPVADALTDALRERGFLVNAPRPDVLRLAPPLVVTAEQVEAFLTALPSALESLAEVADPSAGTPESLAEAP